MNCYVYSGKLILNIASIESGNYLSYLGRFRELSPSAAAHDKIWK